MTRFFQCFITAFLIASSAMARQTPSTQQTAQPQSSQSLTTVSPDAEVQALQIKLKALELQKQIDALKAQQQAIVNPPPPKPPLPPCDATPTPVKPNGWLKRVEQKAAQITAKEIKQAGGKIAQSTHGTIDGSVIPTPQDVSSGTPKPQGPCAPVVVVHPGTSVSQ